MLPALFQNIGLPELIIILLIVLLVFGASRLPALARSLGLSVKEFKKGMQDDEKKPETPSAPENKPK